MPYPLQLKWTKRAGVDGGMTYTMHDSAYKLCRLDQDIATITGLSPRPSAVDFVCCPVSPTSPKSPWLVEVKDFRPQTTQPSIRNTSGLASQINKKVTDSICVLEGQHPDIALNSKDIALWKGKQTRETNFLLHIEMPLQPRVSALYPNGFPITYFETITRDIKNNPATSTIDCSLGTKESINAGSFPFNVGGV